MPLSEHVYCVAVTFKMTERVEQRICVQFCIKLEHCSVETTGMIQKAFGDGAVSAEQTKVCHEPSQTVENLLRVIHVLEGLQQAEPLGMLNVYRL